MSNSNNLSFYEIMQKHVDAMTKILNYFAKIKKITKAEVFAILPKAYKTKSKKISYNGIGDDQYITYENLKVFLESHQTTEPGSVNHKYLDEKYNLGVNDDGVIINSVTSEEAKVNKSEIWEILPLELKTPAREREFGKLDEYICESDFVQFLRFKTTGGNAYVTLEYFIKYYKLALDLNGMPEFNEKFEYGTVSEESLFIWWLLDCIQTDNFISRFVKIPKLLNFCLQERVESEILPTDNNFRFDGAFPNLKKLLEINEPKHSDLDQQINDYTKYCLSKLLSHNLTSIDVNKIFKTKNAYEFKKISNSVNGKEKIHILIKNNAYLMEFKKTFLHEIKCSMMDDKEVRDEMIMDLFKISIERQISEIEYLCNSEVEFLGKIEKASQRIKDDNISIEYYRSILLKLTSGDSNIVLAMFDLKSKCVNVKDGCGILFMDIASVLNIDTDKMDKFEDFLRSMKIRVNVKDINSMNKVTISWIKMSELITAYNSDPVLKKTLEMYHREVGDSYEKIITLLKEHRDSLESNREHLTIYTDHINEKFQVFIEKLKENEARDKLALAAAKVEYTALETTNAAMSNRISELEFISTEESIIDGEVHGSVIEYTRKIKIIETKSERKTRLEARVAYINRCKEMEPRMVDGRLFHPRNIESDKLAKEHYEKVKRHREADRLLAASMAATSLEPISETFEPIVEVIDEPDVEEEHHFDDSGFVEPRLLSDSDGENDDEDLV